MKTLSALSVVLLISACAAPTPDGCSVIESYSGDGTQAGTKWSQYDISCQDAGEVLYTNDSSDVVDSSLAVTEPDACAKLGGHYESTTTLSYMYNSAGGKYMCHWFSYSHDVTKCIYTNSQYEASVANLCTQITHANSCTYSVTTFDQIMGNITYAEADYFNSDMYDADSMAVEKSSCAAKGGAWK
jgi:hypothetical protein